MICFFFIISLLSSSSLFNRMFPQCVILYVGCSVALCVYLVCLPLSHENRINLFNILFMFMYAQFFFLLRLFFLLFCRIVTSFFFSSINSVGLLFFLSTESSLDEGRIKKSRNMKNVFNIHKNPTD